jgi:hypothetical protein
MKTISQRDPMHRMRVPVYGCRCRWCRRHLRARAEQFKRSLEATSMLLSAGIAFDSEKVHAMMRDAGLEAM